MSDKLKGPKELADRIRSEWSMVPECETKTDAHSVCFHLDRLASIDGDIAEMKAKIEKLEAGIAAYRKRAALSDGQQFRDLDEADAWEASLIDVDGQPTQNS